MSIELLTFLQSGSFFSLPCPGKRTHQSTEVWLPSRTWRGWSRQWSWRDSGGWPVGDGVRNKTVREMKTLNGLGLQTSVRRAVAQIYAGNSFDIDPRGPRPAVRGSFASQQRRSFYRSLVVVILAVTPLTGLARPPRYGTLRAGPGD